MSYREQKKLLEELKKFIGKMSYTDSEAFKIFIKREKDDEDFDTVSMSKLRAMHKQYYKPGPKPDLNSLFKS